MSKCKRCILLESIIKKGTKAVDAAFMSSSAPPGWGGGTPRAVEEFEDLVKEHLSKKRKKASAHRRT